MRGYLPSPASLSLFFVPFVVQTHSSPRFQLSSSLHNPSNPESLIILLDSPNAKPPGSRQAVSFNDVGCFAAERVGFEPTVDTRPTTVFETVPFGHSGTSPFNLLECHAVHYAQAVTPQAPAIIAENR
jgi:hypothetical protein